MTLDQQNQRNRRLMAFLASRGLPQDGGFCDAADQGTYPNAAFGALLNTGVIQVNFGAPPTAGQAASVVAAASAWDDSDAAQAAWDLDQTRSAANRLIADRDPSRVMHRATDQVLLDLINELRAKAGLPVRTMPQVMTAIRAKIDAGNADA